uniref:leucine-rich repeat transmembrane protein FLRT3-like n=1 Tax=Myxine glutinosa TaxID=7769 RepID=UPI00358ED500
MADQHGLGPSRATAAAVATLLCFIGRCVCCPPACRCDVHFLYCNDRGLTAIPSGLPIGAATLFMQNNWLTADGLPRDLRGLLTIEVVYLYGNNIERFPDNLPHNTRELHLQENNIGTVARNALARLPRLEQLHLDDNSISTAGIEDGAFFGCRSLRLLFLSRNHLSRVPAGLPMGVEELRLDDNRIHEVDGEVFRNLPSLRRLVLDGNLLSSSSIAANAFSRLGSLAELSLTRNTLLSPPRALPGANLQRLFLQENQITHIELAAFSGLRRLRRLDMSNNDLRHLPLGAFDGLETLAQLLVRNNPWYCDCSMQWLRLWLRSNPVNARGLMCQGPDNVRGMSLKDLNPELLACPKPTSAVTLAVIASAGTTQHSIEANVQKDKKTDAPPQILTPLEVVPKLLPGFSVPAASSTHIPSDGARTEVVGNDPDLRVHVSSEEYIQVGWHSVVSITYRLTWARIFPHKALDQLKAGGENSMREAVVNGEDSRYLITGLQRQSSYHICLTPFTPGSESNYDDTTTYCIEGNTTTGGTTSHDPGKTFNHEQMGHGHPLPLAAIVGGAAAAVLLLLLLTACCCYACRTGRLFRRRNPAVYSRPRKRQDDYVEAGTKKDTSILEIRRSNFQIVPLGGHPVAKDEISIQTIFPSNGTIVYKTDSCSGSNGSSNRLYRDSGVPESDLSHT